MKATYVVDELTPFSFEEATEAMEAALADQIGKKPTVEVLALALAKTALETGRWKKIHNYNWGNIKAGEAYEGMYTCILLNEVLGGKVVWFAPGGQLAGGPGTALVGSPLAVPPGHPQTRMRAYANRYDGAFSYVDFVAGGRYAAAWTKLLAGDAGGYVHALKAAGYFTADEATYAHGVILLQQEFARKLAGHENVPEAVVHEDAFSAAEWISKADAAFDEMLADEKDRGIRDSELNDEERHRLGYDTEPSPPPEENDA